jgi:hypothetical protein
MRTQQCGGEGSSRALKTGVRQAVEEAVDQAQIHFAHEFGVVLRQGVEGAVRAADLPAVDAGLETVCLEYPRPRLGDRGHRPGVRLRGPLSSNLNPPRCKLCWALAQVLR